MNNNRFGYKITFTIPPQSVWNGLPHQTIYGGSNDNWTFLEAAYYLAVAVRQLDREHGTGTVNYLFAVVEPIYA